MTMCAVAPRNMAQESPKFHFKRCLSSEDINLQDRRVEVDPLLLPFPIPPPVDSAAENLSSM